MKFLNIILLMCVFLGGCSVLPQSQSEQPPEELVVLTDYELKDGYIVIKTVSHGCTFFNSFEVAVKDQQKNSLQVVRKRPDECRMKPRTVSLQYSIKHLGLDPAQPIRVDNPLKNNRH